MNLFQFSSNGKGFPNVSSKGCCVVIREEFQFPSNGKGFPNWLQGFEAVLSERVSIPFKRERLSEPIHISELTPEVRSVSIPFKRERLSEQ